MFKETYFTYDIFFIESAIYAFCIAGFSTINNKVKVFIQRQYIPVLYRGTGYSYEMLQSADDCP